MVVRVSTDWATPPKGTFNDTHEPFNIPGYTVLGVGMCEDSHFFTKKIQKRL